MSETRKVTQIKLEGDTENMPVTTTKDLKDALDLWIGHRHQNMGLQNKGLGDQCFRGRYR